MADTKTFKDIDKNIKALVKEIKDNNELTKAQTKKLDDHAKAAAEKAEKGRKPRARVQKEMLKMLQVQTAQDKVRAGKDVTRQDFKDAGFSSFGATLGQMRQWWNVSLKNWWQKTKENSEVLRAVRKFWSSKAMGKFKDLFGTVANYIGDQFREVLGEFTIVFDVFKKAFAIITETLKSFWDGFFAQRQRVRERKMIKHLKKIKEGIGFLVLGEKVDSLTKRKGIGGLWAKLLGWLSLGKVLTGLALGALLGKILWDAYKAWKGGGGWKEVLTALTGWHGKEEAAGKKF
jgi:hypothetical protein